MLDTKSLRSNLDPQYTELLQGTLRCTEVMRIATDEQILRIAAPGGLVSKDSKRTYVC